MSWKSLGPAAVLAAFGLVPQPHAHHPSGVASTGGGGPIATLSATTLEQGASAAGIFFEMVAIDAFSDAQLQGFAGRHLHVHSLDRILAPSLVTAYGLTADLTVSARLPLIMRQDIREGHHSHGPAGNTVDARGDAEGIGDLTLLAQYRFLNDRASRTEAAVLLGVKAPTGRTNASDSFGGRFETEFQPGTGSWDGLFGAAVTQRFGAWSLDANVLYQLASKGAQDTDLGDRFLYNLALTYRVAAGVAAEGTSPRGGRMGLGAAPEAWGEPMYHGGRPGHRAAPAASPTPTLDLVLELNGEWHGHVVEAGVRDPFSGGNIVYLSPGLRLGMGAWSGFVSVGVPVASHVNGIQAEPTWRLLTGVGVAF